jgi:hypothetical protein
MLPPTFAIVTRLEFLDAFDRAQRRSCRLIADLTSSTPPVRRRLRSVPKAALPEKGQLRELLDIVRQLAPDHHADAAVVCLR